MSHSTELPQRKGWQWPGATGMPEWMRIAPTVREMALRLWVGGTIPGVATG